jgi:hypothetical protein
MTKESKLAVGKMHPARTVVPAAKASRSAKKPARRVKGSTSICH